MDTDLLFQLTASVVASVCYGIGFFVWLMSIRIFNLRAIAEKPLISSQVVLGGIALLGVIVSTLLVFVEVKPTNGKALHPFVLLNLISISGISSSIIQHEISCALLLLMLNEVRKFERK